jgi:hypothetical protein
VAKLLTTANNTSMQSLVMRSTFSEDTPGSFSILYAIYALSCLHFGDVQRATEYRTKSFEAVQVSASTHPDTKSVLQRIIATNLLALYDVRSLNQRIFFHEASVADRCDDSPARVR